MTGGHASQVAIKRGAALAIPLAQPSPYAQAVTVWRSGATGRFAPDPTKRPAVAVKLAAKPAGDVVVIKHTLGEGDDLEVVRVTVECTSAKAAQLIGELTKAALRDFEQGLSLHTLQELNPARARELELEEMHKAHRADKGRRAAVSRVRNAEARAKDEAKGKNLRRKKGAK